jgi:hypothetical protein
MKPAAPWDNGRYTMPRGGRSSFRRRANARPANSMFRASHFPTFAPDLLSLVSTCRRSKTSRRDAFAKTREVEIVTP